MIMQIYFKLLLQELMNADSQSWLDINDSYAQPRPSPFPHTLFREGRMAPRLALLLSLHCWDYWTLGHQAWFTVWDEAQGSMHTCGALYLSNLPSPFAGLTASEEVIPSVSIYTHPLPHRGSTLFIWILN